MTTLPLYEGLRTIDKPALVLDIGRKYTKFGFVGEFAPRCIVPTKAVCPIIREERWLRTYKNKEDLYNLLVEFIHKLFFTKVLINPQYKQLVIVESILSLTVFRDTLAEVLFKHFEISSVLFVPSHLVALLTLGINSAIVIDVGFDDTEVVPVYEGVVVLNAWQNPPVAGAAIHEKIKAELLQLIEKTKNGSGDQSVEAFVSDDIVEDIVVRGCFVPSMHRKEVPPSFNYYLTNGSRISVAGDIRRSAFEPFFEKDLDNLSLPHMVLEAVLKCSVDTRRQLLENIVLIGGVAMAPGFKARLMEELKALLNSPEYCKKLAVKTLKFHKLPAKENYTCWLGAAIMGATNALNIRSLTRTRYLELGTVPDWSNLQHNNSYVSNLTL